MAARESSRQTRVAARPVRDTEGGHHARAHPVHRSHRRCCSRSPAACGDSGSSGTGGGDEPSGTPRPGEACEAVAGDQLVVLEDDKQLQTVDNIIPAVNAATAEASRRC